MKVFAILIIISLVVGIGYNVYKIIKECVARKKAKDDAQHRIDELCDSDNDDSINKSKEE